VVRQVPDHENGLVHDVRGSNMTGAKAWGLAVEPMTDYFEEAKGRFRSSVR
jgi:hypothetical protein